MYRAFFGFREKPFNLTPDPKFLYLNASYREALAALHYGVVDRKGFVSLIGEAGTGKTTLLRRLLSELPRETRSVLVINPAIGFEEMLRFILSDLGRPPAAGATKLDMLEVLNAELLDTLARGGNVVVLIDEAQDLTIPVLEELRLLSNLETAKEKILQLVLAGQPELDAMLARPEIRQLRQRISVRARLRPLVRSEVKAYVGARIAAAGGDVRGLFTRPALFRLWWFSAGVPRLVNAACDNALVTAYARGKRTIGWREIGEAQRDLRRQVTWGRGRWRRLATLGAAALAGAAVVLGATWLLRGHPPFAQGGGEGAPPPAAIPLASASPLATEEPVASVTPLATPEPIASPSPFATPEPNASTPPAVVDVPAGDGVPAAVADQPAGEAVPSAVADRPTEAVPATAASPVDTGARGESPSRASDLDATPAVDATPAEAADREDGASALRVQVSAGDTLTDLAQHYYGSASPRVLAVIRAANPWLDDPDVIWTGQTLVLPAPRVTDAPRR